MKKNVSLSQVIYFCGLCCILFLSIHELFALLNCPYPYSQKTLSNKDVSFEIRQKPPFFTKKLAVSTMVVNFWYHVIGHVAPFHDGRRPGLGTIRSSTGAFFNPWMNMSSPLN